jgi:hypothetical protein
MRGHPQRPMATVNVLAWLPGRQRTRALMADTTIPASRAQRLAVGLDSKQRRTPGADDEMIWHFDNRSQRAL